MFDDTIFPSRLCCVIALLGLQNEFDVVLSTGSGTCVVSAGELTQQTNPAERRGDQGSGSHGTDRGCAM